MQYSLVAVLAFAALADASVLKSLSQRSLAAAQAPDATCKNGVRGFYLDGTSDAEQATNALLSPAQKAAAPQKVACCAGYCGECSDYLEGQNATRKCESVRGQASKDACCASNVINKQCGIEAMINGTATVNPANNCLKLCSESHAPCIMDDPKAYNLVAPSRNAADNCSTAVETWRLQAKAALEPTKAVAGAAPPCDETLTGAKGSGYRGCQTLTRSGKTCQKWTSQTPQKHTRTPLNKPGKGLGDHNSCRNPDGEDTIWCYTTDPSKRWEYCDAITR